MPDDGRPGRAPEADLTAELLPGVTWRRTRDALSRLDGQGAHGDALGIVLSLDIVAETAWRWPGEPFGKRGGARRWSAYA